MQEDTSGRSDARLVVSVARGSEDALAEIYRRHGAAVFGLARRVTADPGAADDVAQEVFLRLWQEPDRFDPDRGSLRSFLMAQSHSRAVDVVRSRSARRRREERDARVAPHDGYDLEREVWELTVAEQVTRAMALLPEEERRAIELAYYGGLSYREVAVTLRQPEGTVKGRIRNGLRRLRQSVAEQGVREP